jgi:dihydropteroate synthase
VKIGFKNKELDLSSPAIMGILNITPDSFFDGGKYTEDKAILLQVERMLLEGADILDLGACSTRPNAKEISEEEELKRLIPSVRLIRKKFPGAIISVDTYRSTVAACSVNEGVDMINDVGGGTLDEKMFETIAKLKVPYVLMHIQGTPQTMQANPHYHHVVNEVTQFLGEKINSLKKLGASQLILDVGFGFGKTTRHNYLLLKNLAAFKEFELPILVGISRKGMICKLLEIKAEEALNGTTAANAIALMNGANILRVHDVKQAREAAKIFNFTQNS